MSRPGPLVRPQYSTSSGDVCPSGFTQSERNRTSHGVGNRTGTATSGRLMDPQRVEVTTKIIDCTNPQRGPGLPTRYRLESPEFETRLGQEVFSSPHPSRPGLRPSQPPLQAVPGLLAPGIKRPGRDVDIHTNLVPRLRMSRANLYSTLCLYGVLREATLTNRQ